MNTPLYGSSSALNLAAPAAGTGVSLIRLDPTIDSEELEFFGEETGAGAGDPPSAGPAVSSEVADPRGLRRGGGGVDGFQMEESSFRRCGSGDAVLETAAARLGPGITDAVVIVGDGLVLSGDLSRALAAVKSAGPAERRAALAAMAIQVIVDPSRVFSLDPLSDFQILTLFHQDTAPDERHMRRYQIYHRDGSIAAIPYTAHPNDASREMRRGILLQDGPSLAGMLTYLQQYAAAGDPQGLAPLAVARSKALKLESLGRMLDEGKARRSEPAFLDSEREVTLDLLWQQLEVAQRAIIEGAGLPEGFDTTGASLAEYFSRKL